MSSDLLLAKNIRIHLNGMYVCMLDVADRIYKTRKELNLPAVISNADVLKIVIASLDITDEERYELGLSLEKPCAISIDSGGVVTKKQNAEDVIIEIYDKYELSGDISSNVDFTDIEKSFDTLIRQSTRRTRNMIKLGVIPHLNESIITLCAGRQIGHTTYIYNRAKTNDIIITQNDNYSDAMKRDFKTLGRNPKDFSIMSIKQFERHIKSKTIHKDCTIWIDVYIGTLQYYKLYQNLIKIVSCHSKEGDYVRIIKFGATSPYIRGLNENISR